MLARSLASSPLISYGLNKIWVSLMRRELFLHSPNGRKEGQGERELGNGAIRSFLSLFAELISLRPNFFLLYRSLSLSVLTQPKHCICVQLNAHSSLESNPITHTHTLTFERAVCFRMGAKDKGSLARSFWREERLFAALETYRSLKRCKHNKPNDRSGSQQQQQKRMFGT